MKLADLRVVKQPKAEKRACIACKSFAAECLVPVGEDAVPMCWLCAHHVIDHETPVHEACAAECECLPEQVYPADVIAGQASAGLVRFPHGDGNGGDHPVLGHWYNQKTGEIEAVLTPREKERETILQWSPQQLTKWVREAHKQMSDAQNAAVLKRVAKL